MRATRAYLAGLGTAGTLVLGASILFVLGSAVVAFNGWPKLGGIGSPVTQTLIAHPKAGSHSTSRGLAAVAVVKPRPATHVARTTPTAAKTSRAAGHAAAPTQVSHRRTTSASISRPVAGKPRRSKGSSKPTSHPTTTPTPTTPTPTTPTPVASTPVPVSTSSGSSNPVGTVTTVVSGTGTVTSPGTVASHPSGTPVVTGTGSSGTGIKVVGSVHTVGSTSASTSTSTSSSSTTASSSPTPVISSTGSSSGANPPGVSHGIGVGLTHSVSNVISSQTGGDGNNGNGPGSGGPQPGHGPCPPPAGPAASPHGYGGPRYGHR